MPLAHFMVSVRSLNNIHVLNDNFSGARRRLPEDFVGWICAQKVSLRRRHACSSYLVHEREFISKLGQAGSKLKKMIIDEWNK